MRRARQAHGLRGTRLSTPLAPYQTAILMDWLNEAAGVAPEPSTTNTPAVGQNAGPNLTAASAEAEGEVTEAMVDEAARELLNRGKEKTRTAFTPRDQFDPEIFNRRRARAESKKASDKSADASTGDVYVPETIDFPPRAPESAEESPDLPTESPSRD